MVYSTRRFVVFPCVILFLCFSVLLLRLPRLWGWGGAGLGAFLAFVRFVLVWVCRFPLPLGVGGGGGLRFMIVALPGLFSYLFCLYYSEKTLSTRYLKNGSK